METLEALMKQERMMINVKKTLVVMAIAAAFSGCGKDNYNGRYVGYEQKIMNSQAQPGMYPNYPMQNFDERIELDLKHDDEMVSGTVTYPDSGLTGQLTATSEKSNRLDNVEIRMGYSPQTYQGGYTGGNYGMGMNCIGAFAGSLEALGDGKRLKGTLSALNTSNSAFGYSTCSGKSITVNKQ